MPNTTPKTTDLQAFAKASREANARLLEAGRKTSDAYLDGVETYVAEFTRAERKLGEQTKVESVAAVLGAHADLTDELVRIGVTAAREAVAA